MYSGSQFDGTTAFTSSQANETTPLAASRSKAVGLVPVTVKQISEANSMINDIDAANLTLVGIVADKASRNTDVSFVLDDGTGQIKCRRWVNDSYDSRELEMFEDGAYVRVDGHLKTFQGSRQMHAFCVRSVTKFDEVSCHFIECIHNYLLNNKSQQGNASTQHHSSETSLTTPIKNESNGPQTTSSSQLSATTLNFDAQKGCDQLIVDYLELPSSSTKERGIHVDELCRQLKIPMDKIKESIRTLEDEGLIYSTIDEFHFKSAAS